MYALHGLTLHHGIVLLLVHAICLRQPANSAGIGAAATSLRVLVPCMHARMLDAARTVLQHSMLASGQR